MKICRFWLKPFAKMLCSTAAQIHGSSAGVTYIIPCGIEVEKISLRGNLASKFPMTSTRLLVRRRLADISEGLHGGGAVSSDHVQ